MYVKAEVLRSLVLPGTVLWGTYRAALGWMHSANVVQMVSYVEPTWFGYGGWGGAQIFH